MSLIKSDETLNELNKVNRKIIQKKDGFRFSIDAVLLANFINLRSKKKIAEVGTGTGVIPLILADNLEKIDAYEIQSEIADMAKRSVTLNSLETKINIINLDIKNVSKKYDIIISNPPYLKINNGKISQNSNKAIARHEVALTLGDLLSFVERNLRNNGEFFIIYRSERFLELISSLEKHNMFPMLVRFIHTKPELESKMFLMKINKKNSEFLKIEKPLLIYEENGIYTKEVKSYFLAIP